MRSQNVIISGLIVLALLLVGGGVYVAMYSSNTSQYQNLPTMNPPVSTATASSTPSGTATTSPLVLTAVSPLSAPVGATITLTGKGFATLPPDAQINQPAWQNKSHLIVWVTKQDGTTAVLWEGNPGTGSDTVITARVNRFLCTDVQNTSNGFAGVTTSCQKPFALTPGSYTLTASIPYLTLLSNQLSFVVTASSLSSKTYTNTKYHYTLTYPDDLSVKENNNYPPVPGVGVTSTTFDFPKTYYPGGTISQANIDVAVTPGTCTLWPDKTQTFPATTGSTTPNGLTFDLRTNSDAGAGNFYTTREYSFAKNNLCYRLALFDHSSNPGAYTSDPAAIAKYTAENQAAEDMFSGVMGQVVQSFALSK